MDDFERRPNPPGWVPPKAPYNPYDPSDLRPAKGYPSEFSAPGKLKENSGTLAQDVGDFSKLRIDMKRLEYFPRPASELYPGRYKVLRRVNYTNKFERGARLTGISLMVGFTVLGVFFFRWNDYDHVLAPFRRMQLRAKEWIMGELNDQDYRDLYYYDQARTIPQKPLPSIVYEKNQENDLVHVQDGNEFVKDRFGVKHVVQAEKVRQNREETLMRALDTAQSELEKRQEAAEKKKWWKWS
ncbi:hypothetical protein KL905_003909 [Ogataea polymorpha]|uniref:Uncharacterized protein n=1 Tax=Ogataea polymorpha TaxID=460523 RepID=A0A1B7SFQ0_9ASCO|nr:uncharacterized protein OGAPODRAFT_17007 [Ogataea polymorpha]KAG7878249.1 hypothetical protein KL937_003991 [Ogataea polymorpha]KAG7890234.1 hypothetical protein KL908_004572 [Ogataea polymorpha]KAG7898604.1 hypothetical protein KL935_004203 [Ogataea polymorpha]KAG7901572.1 hypothetical protein KL907_004242 [Ogataea polymorpha]KAG7907067.1 hypothetical protein KL906_004253 [Ogataea polymorpha]